VLFRTNAGIVASPLVEIIDADLSRFHDHFVAYAVRRLALLDHLLARAAVVGYLQ
jgi:hypothetical protein